MNSNIKRGMVSFKTIGMRFCSFLIENHKIWSYCRIDDCEGQFKVHITSTTGDRC